MAPLQWYVKSNDTIKGPFSSAQLKQLASLQKINRETLVRLGDSGQWSSASRVKNLFASELIAVAANQAVIKPPPVKLVTVVEETTVSNRRSCPICGEEIAVSAIKCRHCNEWLDGREINHAPLQLFVNQSTPAPAPVQQAPTPVTVTQTVINQNRAPRWDRGTAAVLSLLLPGAGQVYKGQPVNGLLWFVMTVLGYLVFIIPGLIMHLLCVLGAASGDPYK